MNRLKEKTLKAVNTLSNKADSIKMKASVLAMAVLTPLLNSVNAYAAGSGTKDAGSIVEGIIDVVVTIFPLIGGFFVVAGVFKLIMAYRNNQPEDQSSAAKDIVIGAVFIVFWAFVWTPIKTLIF